MLFTLKILFYFFFCYAAYRYIDKWKLTQKILLNERIQRNIDFLSHYLRHQQGDPSLLPFFKFYTQIIGEIVATSRALGVSIDKEFTWIKKRLEEEKRFLSKLKELKNGVWAQIILIGTFSWIFALFTSYQLQLKFFKIETAIMVVLQLLGVATFLFAFKYLYQKMFSSLELFFLSFVKTRVLSNVSLSGKQLSGILSKSDTKDKNIQELKGRLGELLEIRHTQGVCINSELDSLGEDYLFLLEGRMTRFVKAVEALKLAVLLVFFLPCHFILLYSIMNTVVNKPLN